MLREYLRVHPSIGIAAASGVILIGTAVLWAELRGPNRVNSPSLNFYTDDDGATQFKDDATKSTPFDHDGKPAVRAYMFTCDGGGHKWVGYLEKHSDADKRKIDAGGTPGGSMLVKKPGATSWISASNFQKVQEIVSPKCPDGMGSGQVQQVNP